MVVILDVPFMHNHLSTFLTPLFVMQESKKASPSPTLVISHS